MKTPLPKFPHHRGVPKHHFGEKTPLLATLLAGDGKLPAKRATPAHACQTSLLTLAGFLELVWADFHFDISLIFANKHDKLQKPILRGFYNINLYLFNIPHHIFHISNHFAKKMCADPNKKFLIRSNLTLIIYISS